jgi:hypothetical protein
LVLEFAMSLHSAAARPFPAPGGVGVAQPGAPIERPQPVDPGRPPQPQELPPAGPGGVPVPEISPPEVPPPSVPPPEFPPGRGPGLEVPLETPHPR